MGERYADFYRRSVDDVEAFWTEQARYIDWHTPFQRVLASGVLYVN